MNLTDTQEIIWRLIAAPEGVARGLEELAEVRRRLPGGLDALVRGDERLGAVERLSVYADMYFFRLLDCLREDFPAVHAVVEHDRFHGLAGDYLAAHPSESFSVRQLGRRLPDFVAGHPVATDLPWLADLARFEWALLEAFDAADAEPVAAERLKAVEPERWAELRFRFTPSLRVVEAGWPVQEVWTAATAGREAPAPAPAPTVLRIWRQDLRVFHRSITPVELAVLREVEAGRDFESVCEAGAALGGRDGTAPAIVAILQRWFADEMIVGWGRS